MINQCVKCAATIPDGSLFCSVCRPHEGGDATDAPNELSMRQVSKPSALVTRRGDEPRHPGSPLECVEVKPRQPKEHPGFKPLDHPIQMQAAECRRCHCFVDNYHFKEHAEVCHD